MAVVLFELGDEAVPREAFALHEERHVVILVEFFAAKGRYVLHRLVAREEDEGAPVRHCGEVLDFLRERLLVGGQRFIRSL